MLGGGIIYQNACDDPDRCMELISERHAFYGVPVYKLLNVVDFDPKVGDEPRIYDIPIGKAMRLRAFVNPRPAEDKVVRVGFHGAVPTKIPTGDSFFEPGAIYASRQDPYILFADPTLTLNRELRLSWYLGAAWVDPDDFMEKMTRKLMSATGAAYMLAGGGSGGGFAAARFATRFRNGVACAKIPHTDLFRRPPGALGPTLAQEWKWDKGRVLRTAPTRFRLADIYGDPRWNRGNLLHIVQHAGDSVHMEDHLKPFLRELGAPDDAHKLLDGRITISRPYVGDGHVPVPASLWQAEDDIALARLKAARPQALDEPIEDLFVKPEGLVLNDQQLAERSRTFKEHYEI